MNIEASVENPYAAHVLFPTPFPKAPHPRPLPVGVGATTWWSLSLLSRDQRSDRSIPLVVAALEILLHGLLADKSKLFWGPCLPALFSTAAQENQQGFDLLGVAPALTHLRRSAMSRASRSPQCGRDLARSDSAIADSQTPNAAIHPGHIAGRWSFPLRSGQYEFPSRNSVSTRPSQTGVSALASGGMSAKGQRYA